MNESYVLAEVSNENQTLVAVVQQDHRAAYFTFIPPKPTAIAIRCAPAGCATRRRAVAGRSRRAGTRAAADAGGGVLPQHGRRSAAEPGRADGGVERKRRRRGPVVLRPTAGGDPRLEPVYRPFGVLFRQLYQGEPVGLSARLGLDQHPVCAGGEHPPVLAQLAA